MARLNLFLVLSFCTFNIAHGKFENISNLGQPWQNIANQVKHTVVKFDIIGSGRCTGTIISDEGHVLTALHCFHNCLRSHRSYDVHSLNNEYRTDYFATLNQSNLPTCNMRYKNYSFEKNDDLEEEILYADAELVATGMGKILLNRSNPDIDSVIDFHLGNETDFMSLRESGVGRIIGDYAIFKSEAFAGKKCTKLKPSKKTDQTLTLSFPSYTFGRKTGDNPNGRSMYASVGEISSKGLLLSDSAFVKALKQEYTNEEINSAYTFKEDIIWSDNDSLAGASGSLSFDQSGNPFSLVTYNICDGLSSKKQGCRFSTGSLTISRILADIQKTLREEVVSDILSCELE